MLINSECSEFFEQNHIDGDNRHADRYFALRDEMGVIYCCLSLLRRRIQVSGDTIGRLDDLLIRNTLQLWEVTL